MILAAGLGKRMRPLTEHTPKPLLKVAGKALIEYPIESLAALGVREIVINHAHLGQQIEAALGDGSRYGVAIQYSAESEPLETAGGIIQALPLLGEQPFMVINADVWSDYPLQRLLERTVQAAHLVLVANPEHNRGGDFGLSEDGRVYLAGQQASSDSYTFAGISVLSQRLFEGFEAGKLALLAPLKAAIARGEVSGECFSGRWVDVGTPQRLQQLDRELRAESM